MISAQQVRKLRSEYWKSGSMTKAAMKADVDWKTAKKYLETTKMPSDLSKPRNWRTREDPFEEVWPEVENWLRAAPELEAKALFDFLCELHPGKFVEGQLRTFQRRIADFHVLHGPDKEVFFRAGATLTSYAGV